ncbi:MAG: hypothetical protein EWV82_05760 [Microcystis aeruginosa Ma_AC_P_19900807_S299]|nr:MAG: hypothetical protein EWV82_05760 [Microcystis aeruginosa Ma_AC_P_19900807_S299]
MAEISLIFNEKNTSPTIRSQESVISYQLSVISSLRKLPTPHTPHPTPHTPSSHSVLPSPHLPTRQLNHLICATIIVLG